MCIAECVGRSSSRFGSDSGILRRVRGVETNCMSQSNIQLLLEFLDQTALHSKRCIVVKKVSRPAEQWDTPAASSKTCSLHDLLASSCLTRSANAGQAFLLLNSEDSPWSSWTTVLSRSADHRGLAVAVWGLLQMDMEVQRSGRSGETGLLARFCSASDET